MTPFPQLQAAQADLVALCGRSLEGCPLTERAGHADELCRRATAITQVREEVVHPWLVGRLPAAAHDLAVIELDLVRVLVHELVASRPRDLMYDALVESLCRLLRHRFEAEAGPAGEWTSLAPADCRDIDETAAARLSELDRAGREGQWTPLQPYALETLRSAIPDGVIPWSDL